MSTPPRQGFWYWLAFSGGAVLLVAVAIYSLIGVYANLEVRAQLRRLAEQGKPTTPAELARPRPPARNAADTCRQAFALLAEEPRPGGTADGDLNCELSPRFAPLAGFRSVADVSQWTDEQLLWVSATLHSAGYAQVRDLLRQASTEPDCNFGLRYQDGIGMRLSHLKWVRYAVHLLCLDAATQWQKGRLEEPIESLLIGWRLARHLEQDPTMYSQVLVVSLNATLGRCLRTGLPPGKPVPELARQLIEELGLHGTAAPFIRAIQVERVVAGLSCFEHLDGGAQPAGPSRAPADVARAAPGGLLGACGALMLLPIRRCDELAYLGLMEEAEASASRLWPDVLARNRSDTSAAASLSRVARPGPVTESLTPALGRFREKQTLHHAGVTVVRVGLALAVFRSQQGKFPEQLSELVPSVLPRVPADPAATTPLVYRPTAGGFNLYSLGLNTVDDGGVPGRGCGNGDGGDIVWHYGTPPALATE